MGSPCDMWIVFVLCYLYLVHRKILESYFIITIIILQAEFHYKIANALTRYPHYEQHVRALLVFLNLWQKAKGREGERFQIYEKLLQLLL